MTALIHIARDKPSVLFSPLFLDELKPIGNLNMVENGKDLTDAEKIAMLQKAEIALTGWESEPIPEAIVDDPGSLKYICHITGEIKSYIPRRIIESDIVVSNWGDTPAISVAEGTMALLLSVLKDLHHQITTVREDGWSLGGEEFGGTLHDARVGVYGCGAIGHRLCNLMRPFGPEILIFDPYCETLPEGCTRVETLRELFEKSEIVTICAGLSDETRNSVTAELLSMLPRHGIVINTARGAIIDQDALFAELSMGRIRAGLDVLEPDKLSQGHPARRWKNLILSAHEIFRGWPTHGNPPTKLSPAHRLCIDNLSAFVRGNPVRFSIDLERYARSS